MADPAARRGAIFAIGVLLALFTGYAIGRVSQPVPGDAAGAVAHSHGAGDRYALEVLTGSFVVGVERPLRFVIRGADGAAVTRFDTVHEKRLHLIVVREDLSGYRHLHPTMGVDGTWTVPLTLGAAGVWRMYADFTVTGGAAATLGALLAVPGEFVPSAGPAGPVVDGYSVALSGAGDPLLVRVSRAGAAVPLDRYLGAFGHLVALRETDLAYVHVHPDLELVDGAMRFRMAVPAPGRYRVFVEFSTVGVVRTAEFALSMA